MHRLPHLKSSSFRSCEIIKCLQNYSSSFSRLFSTLLYKAADCRYRKYITNGPMQNRYSSAMMRLQDYDCIGFDLDNTLCEYNIPSCIEMEYNVLANYLVKEKGYDPNYMLKPLDKNSIDFLQKGLIVDFSHGNILKISVNGTILKASHGTKFLTDNEICDVYGKEKKWEVTSEFCKNMLVAWNGPLAKRMRALLDYFDMPASLAFARIIDSLDHRLGRPADIYNVWPDVLAGINNMYSRDHFAICEGGYFKEVKCNPNKFIKKCDAHVIDWLKEIKKSKITFLITGSNCDFASLTAETCLGKDWRGLFDIIVCYAKKPVFFTGCRPFIDLNGFTESDPVIGHNLEFGKMYNQGNWQELYQLFASRLKKKEPKCLYFGDNLIQDVYTPSKYTKCDAVAIVEELSVETNEKSMDNHNANPSEGILSSQLWGSYFYDHKIEQSTVWGGIIKKHSKVCVSTLSAFAQHSVEHEFKIFGEHSKDGYFPVSPDNDAFKKEVHLV